MSRYSILPRRNLQSCCRPPAKLCWTERIHYCAPTVQLATTDRFPKGPCARVGLCASGRLSRPTLSTRFQTLLTSWREEDAKASRYGLGLKDLLGTLRALYDNEVDADHAAAVDASFVCDKVVDANLSTEACRVLIKTLAHAQLSRQPRISHAAEIDSMSANLRQAVRGRHAAHDLPSAIVPGHMAAALLEDRKKRLGAPAWTPALEAALAKALNNRGVAQVLGWNVKGALTGLRSRKEGLQ
jgi:hypothetical protein